MTTDPKRWLIALPLVALGWIGTLALVMFPPEGLVRALPADVSVVSSGPVSVTLRGGTDLVATLYALGAPLVLPAGLTGCLPYTG